MAESIQSFISGIDKDSSSITDLSKKARNLTNWHLITDDGGSSGSLENVKGNKLYFSLPDTSPVVTFTATDADDGAVHGGEPVDIVINGVIYTDNSGTNTATTNAALRDLFVDLINNSTIFAPFSIVAAPSGTANVVIYSTDSAITTLDMNPVTNSHIGSVTQTVPVQTNLVVIGWTTIRDDFILMTCSKNNPVTGGPGQKWRLSYSPETVGTTYNTTLTLLYNNNLNLTTSHPIPSPGAILGRFENSNIKRLYYTDNFNRVRSFNTADPDGFGIPVENLPLSPSVAFSIPIFQGVSTGGALPSGVYQYAYSLQTDGGKESFFSNLSNMIPVNDEDESLATTLVTNYDGIAPNTATSKQNTVSISGLDTDFDTIRVVSLFRTTELGIPEIRIIREEPIPATGEFSFDHTGNETTTSLTLEEFSLLSNAFTHCKTIEQKDNILFAGNTRSERLDLDFDARAFRFDDASIGPNDTGGYVVGTEPETLDDINPDQGKYKFQSDGSTIGGEGLPNANNSNLPNVTYEIFPSGLPLTSNLAERNHIQDSQQAGQFSAPARLAPHRQPIKGIIDRDLDVAGQIYPEQYFFQNFSAPSHHGLFKGYARKETYRFALVFYDTDGTPDFARWIADIKMPGVFETTITGRGDFPVATLQSNVPSFFRYYTHPLAIKFTINLPASIRDKIGGYSIVRVKRAQGDKTILSQGALGSVIHGYPDLDIQAGNINATSSLEMGALGLNGSGLPLYVRGFFPDTFFKNRLDHKSGDYLECLCAMERSVHDVSGPVGGGGNGQDVITDKMYSVDQQQPLFGTADVVSGVQIAQGAISVPVGSGVDTFTNRITQGGEVVRGQKCFFMEINNIRNPSNTGSGGTGVESGLDTFSAYLVNYVRPNSSQYGGNSLSQKSTNSYMSCGHFQPVNNTSPLSYTFDVYGGDIFHPVWDFQERLQNNEVDGASLVNIDFSHINFFVPVETTLDIDLRTGISINRNTIGAGTVNSAANSNGGDVVEQGNIYEYYDLENDVKFFVARPLNSILIDEFDNRAHASQVKINGELTDQWTRFLPADTLDVEGTYGPINNFVKIADQIICFQDKAFGIFSINPTELIQSQTGAEVILGKGTVLQRFTYVSTEIGCKHQWGTIVTRNSVVFFDIFSKKMYRYDVGGGTKPLSDVKGLQSFFANNLDGLIQITDNPILRIGITATYDMRFNEAIFTFLDTADTVIGVYEVVNSFYSSVTNLPINIVSSLSPGDSIGVVNPISGIASQVSIVSILNENSIRLAFGGAGFTSGDPITLTGTFISKFTIAYNDQVDAFTSFYDFFPSLYINDRRLIITPDPDNEENLYIHNENEYGDFYGTKFPSTIQALLNPAPDRTKVNDNLQFYTEATIDGVDQPVTTFNTLRCRNDHQDSGVQVLTNGNNIKRKERNWNLAVPRASDRSRLRDKSMLVDLSFANVSNIRFVLHYIKSFFRSSAR